MDRKEKRIWRAFGSVITVVVDIILVTITALILASYMDMVNVIFLIVEWLISLVMELFLAYLFGYRRKEQLAYLTGICTMTQCSGNIILWILMIADGIQFLLWYIPVRFLGFVVEAVCYGMYLDRKENGRVGRKVMISLIGNGLSGFLNLMVAFDIAMAVSDFLRR